MNSPFIKQWIPDQGDLFPLEEFKKMIKAGAFIDDDGYGNPAIQFEGKTFIDPDTILHPSSLEDEEGNATHIVWYNR